MIKLQNNDAKTSFQNFIDSMSKILEKHAPKLNKCKCKFKTKPLVSIALQESISIKNKIFKDFINKKELTQKTKLHIKYKRHRNMLSTLMKTNKQNSFIKFF